MLISFSTQNFKCFNSLATLSLRPAAYSQHLGHVLRTDSETGSQEALRFAAIYGANASGKTKLVDALAALRQIVVKGRGPNSPLPVSPFLLTTESTIKLKSHFEIVFSHEERTFEYGLVADKETIWEEWLVEIKKGKKTVCFERAQNSEKTKFSIGTALARKNSTEYKKIELVSELTSKNQSFLKKCSENRITGTQAAYTWFSSILTIVGADSTFQSLEVLTGKDDDFAHFIGESLRLSGTGITAIRSHEIDIDLEKRTSLLNDSARQKIQDDLEKSKSVLLVNQSGNISRITKNEQGKVVEYTLKAKHIGTNEFTAEFDFHDESHGTQRLVHLLPIIYQANRKKRVYVVDELDRKLHPLLTRKFLLDFDVAAEKTKSQLIFTTHDTNILDNEVLRRDEIWFIEKCSRRGCSELYPLSDYDVRSDLKLEKGYLQGRFGAIPYFGSNPTIEI